MASKKKYVQGMESPMGKAYMAAKKEQDGPIETTLEAAEEQLKEMIRAADKVILDAADTAKKIPGAILGAAETVVGAGIDGAKSAGKSWLGAVKALGSFLTSSGGSANNVFSTYVPPKKPNPGSPSDAAERAKGGKLAKVVPPTPEYGPGKRRRPMPIIKPRPSGMLPGETLPPSL
jgi:hypothetical protein